MEDIKILSITSNLKMKTKQLYISKRVIFKI
jgi:hypothetical protein